MDIYKPLIALLAIVNPIGAVPFYIHFTQNLNRVQRQRTVRVSAFTAFAVIAVSAVAGLRIIEFFGISLASFQVGGGTLLLISSLQMLNAKPAEARTDTVSEGENKLDAGDSIAVVPLTIPLLTGPATISTVVIYADKTRHWWEHAVLVGYGVVIGAGGLGLLQHVRHDRARAGQDRHQRDDAADGPDPRRAGGGGDGRWPGQAVPGAGQPGRPLTGKEVLRVSRLHSAGAQGNT